HVGRRRKRGGGGGGTRAQSGSGGGTRAQSGSGEECPEAGGGASDGPLAAPQPEKWSEMNMATKKRQMKDAGWEVSVDCWGSELDYRYWRPGSGGPTGAKEAAKKVGLPSWAVGRRGIDFFVGRTEAEEFVRKNWNSGAWKEPVPAAVVAGFGDGGCDVDSGMDSAPMPWKRRRFDNEACSAAALESESDGSDGSEGDGDSSGDCNDGSDREFDDDDDNGGSEGDGEHVDGNTSDADGGGSDGNDGAASGGDTGGKGGNGRRRKKFAGPKLSPEDLERFEKSNPEVREMLRQEYSALLKCLSVDSFTFKELFHFLRAQKKWDYVKSGDDAWIYRTPAAIAARYPSGRGCRHWRSGGGDVGGEVLGGGGGGNRGGGEGSGSGGGGVGGGNGGENDIEGGVSIGTADCSDGGGSKVRDRIGSDGGAAVTSHDKIISASCGNDGGLGIARATDGGGNRDGAAAASANAAAATATTAAATIAAAAAAKADAAAAGLAEGKIAAALAALRPNVDYFQREEDLLKFMREPAQRLLLFELFEYTFSSVRRGVLRGAAAAAGFCPGAAAAAMPTPPRKKRPGGDGGDDNDVKRRRDYWLGRRSDLGNAGGGGGDSLAFSAIDTGAQNYFDSHVSGKTAGAARGAIATAGAAAGARGSLRGGR
ncbi:unnamed protein product, partial [Phaeothamnion confervicola]